MANDLPSEGGGAKGAFPPSGNPAQILDVLGGEPGLIEHILTFLPKGSFKSDDLVEASRLVGLWLQTSKQANQLDAHALWTTLQKSYFPNAPTPHTGFGFSARGLFVEMFHRHRHFAAARVLSNRLNTDFDAAVCKMNRILLSTPQYSVARRQKWEIGQSLHAAKLDLGWRASFLSEWHPGPKPVPIQRQNGGVLP